MRRENHTVRPGIYIYIYSKLLYKMGHYLLDILYILCCSDDAFIDRQIDLDDRKHCIQILLSINHNIQ